MKQHERKPDATLMGTSASRLRPLRDAEVDLPDELDVRGRVVRDSEGSEIGTVHQLIMEMDTRAVRYLDVALHASDDEAERHVLIPAGLARITADQRAVVLPTLERATLARLSPFKHEELTRDRECELLGELQGLSGPAEDTPDFYSHVYFVAIDFLPSQQGRNAHDSGAAQAERSSSEPRARP